MPRIKKSAKKRIVKSAKKAVRETGKLAKDIFTGKAIRQTLASKGLRRLAKKIVKGPSLGRRSKK